MSNNYDFIRNFQFFSNLDDDTCKDLNENATTVFCKKDSYVISPGQKCTYVYLVKNGLVKGGIYSEFGDELNSGRFGENSIFGLYSINEEGASDFFYQAIDDTNLIAIKTTYFSSILKNNGAFCFNVLELFGKTLLKSIDKRIDILFYDNKRQIIKFLLQLIKQHGDKIGHEILVKHRMTIQQISNHVGCSRQSVSIIINELKTESIIYSYSRNSFLIKDIEKLKSKLLSLHEK